MRNQKSYRIVIADDEGVIRMGLRTMLHTLGHTVVGMARNGEEAVTLVQSLAPDLLLLDIKMPKMDGVAVARQLTAESPLPIVMLTAFSQRSLVMQVAENLVMGYLVKPVDESKLAPTLDLAMSRFADYRATKKTAAHLRERLSAQEIISAAKKTLMAQGMTEQEAYRHLQMQARTRRKTLAAVAGLLLSEIG